MKRAAVAASLLTMFFVAMTFAHNAGKSSSSAKAASTDEVNKLEKQVRDSVVKGDTSVLERVTGDDFLMIDADGMMFDKNQSIQMMKDGNVKITSIDVKDEKLRRYGDTVIYNGLGDVKMSVNGQDHNVEQRVTIVWQSRTGSGSEYRSTRPL